MRDACSRGDLRTARLNFLNDIQMIEDIIYVRQTIQQLPHGLFGAHEISLLAAADCTSAAPDRPLVAFPRFRQDPLPTFEPSDHRSG